METGTILGAIKYLSLAIAALSSILGLATQTSYEDAQKRKRLTIAGQASIVITLVAMLLGMLAYGFEMLAKRDADRSAVEKADREREGQRAEKERSERIAFLRETARKADAAEQRYLLLTAQAEQRRSDADISRRVAEGAARNLIRTEAALGQLERLMQPLDAPTLTVTWAIDTDLLPEDDYGRLLRETVATWRRVGGIEAPADTLMSIPLDGSRTTIIIGPKSPLHPRQAKGKTAMLLASMSTRFDLIANTAVVNTALGDARAEHSFPSDYRILIGGGLAGNPTTRFFLRDDRLEMEVEQKDIDPATINRSGAVASVKDIGRATVIISAVPFRDYNQLVPWAMVGGSARALELKGVVLRVGGRRFIANGHAMCSFRSTSGEPVSVGALRPD